ncbi:TP53-target gene 3 protein [Gorilla gorilla gorilla]|uniref:TP53-target gene 3 protein n=1 Tax=Gorilla gorilla gorilla TaxID=9595 RepID=UPI00029D9ACA|nr:TP53-target gene 3 protein isoform X1 [Gorilla gorilla gorilla]XP_055220424.1 TP53-target gene 3 protein isoform X1 [Gorilla gorilla gorilla]XP_055220425.1 TP53-target gene 3 protein isoform X1 [Gorilla gorilla gorilla]XP_055220642.1 TP53-target gene 3 protein isoform X1 [Gorilla gorilla gorilla]XP_055220643.1 TP53-target gene 3 protein isoform X1 [Gorilla gorilla gorilla]XP_055222774.1 TP53-target gene 3 protein isoform X1 [Gorilla gorilla gorilla]XP_055222775.1 TP53-target gene 3 protein
MRASPCISQPAASWHPRPSALRPTAGSGPDTRTPGTVEDGSTPCPAFRSPAVSPCREEPCCFQISPAEETLELGRLVSPGNCDTLSPRAAGFYACHVRSLIPCRSTKGRWPLTASAAGLSRLSQILCTPGAPLGPPGSLRGPYLGRASHGDFPASVIKKRKRHSGRA